MPPGAEDQRLAPRGEEERKGRRRQQWALLQHRWHDGWREHLMMLLLLLLLLLHGCRGCRGDQHGSAPHRSMRLVLLLLRQPCVLLRLSMQVRLQLRLVLLLCCCQLLLLRLLLLLLLLLLCLLRCLP